MSLEVVTLLVSCPLVLWGLINSEVSALKATLADGRSALAAALAAQARELALTQALATSEYAARQHSLDVARGLLLVRAVLEQIAFGRRRRR
jgi:hypothetical protein